MQTAVCLALMALIELWQFFKPAGIWLKKQETQKGPAWKGQK